MDREHQLYDFHLESLLAQPCTSLQWGQPTTNALHQKIYFCCNIPPNCFLFMALVNIPPFNHRYFHNIHRVYNQHRLKKYQHLNIKAIIQHPGEANTIKHNGRWLASKNDNNVVYGWADGKKSTQWVLASPKDSFKPNFVLNWSNSSTRLISSSGKNIDVYDILSGSRRELNSMTASIPPFLSLQGHQGFTEDACFKSFSNQLACSVGLDRKLIIWDIRMNKSILSLQTQHSDDINCVCWHQNEIMTGGSDSKLLVFDVRAGRNIVTRTIGSPLMSMQYSPDYKLLGVGSDRLYIYRPSEIVQQEELIPLFTHGGLRGLINDFSWNREDQRSIIATSQEPQPEGGCVHIFRGVQLLFMQDDELQQQIATLL